MNWKRISALSLLAFVAVVAIVVINKPKSDYRSPEQRALATALATKSADANEAEKKLEKLVADTNSSSDPEIRDIGGRAKIELAYMAANEGDHEKAKALFEDVDQNLEGSGKIDPSFGTLNDQAAYQAIALLMKEGKSEEAEEALLEFIKERPLSPLVHGAVSRLNKLKPENREAHNKLLDEAIAKQDEFAKERVAMCGPMVVSRAIELLGKTKVSEEVIANIAGTSIEEGTTMSGLQDSLSRYGFDSKGMMLNFDDFMKADLPFIWLVGDHYRLVENRSDLTLQVYDPMINGKDELKLSDKNSDQFKTTVLLITKKNFDKGNQS